MATLLCGKRADVTSPKPVPAAEACKRALEVRTGGSGADISHVDTELLEKFRT